MTPAPCARSWQAEAMVDGRLSSADARSFKRHAAGCDVCRNEMDALAALREMGQRLPVPEQSELDRRRSRQELLRRANTLTVDRGEPPRWRWALAAAGLCAIVAVAIAIGRGVVPEQVASTFTPAYQLTPDPSATWAVLEQGATLRLGLTRGRLEVAVDKLGAGQRFVIALPDGELEVRGTRFAVVAEEGRTRSVVVTEGAVSLALHGRPRLLLERGESFPRADEASTVVPDAVPSASPEGRTAAVQNDPTAQSPRAAPPTARSTPTASAEPRAFTAPAPASAKSPAAPSPVASPPTFARAMAAFGGGDYGLAESLFHAFERENPGDARVEDTTFLRAVARKRRGDAGGAATAAREYLRKYPSGFRRHEAELLLR